MSKLRMLADSTLDVDVSLVGTSTTLFQLIPDVIDSVTGISSYNLGMMGVFYHLQAPLLLQYNKRDTRSLCYVLTVHPISFQKQAGRIRKDYWAAFIDNKGVYESLYAQEPEVAWRLRYIPLYRLTQYTKQTYNRLTNSYASGIKTRGFVAQNGEIKEQDAYDQFNSFEVDSSLVTSFHELAKEIAKKRKVLILATPVFSTSAENEPYIEALKEMASDQIKVLDHSNRIHGKQYFFDEGHLNHRGAKVYSKLVGEEIRNFLDQP